MYKIVTDFVRPPADLVDIANQLYFCLVGGRVGPRYVMDSGIKALERDWRVCGPAFTVRPEKSEDLTMASVAGKYVKPGDVVVIDAAGNQTSAALGPTMASGLKDCGATGVVIDGCVLGAEVFRKREDIPLFCRGSVSHSADSEGPGWLNVPIICGGVIVNPGDLVLGDEDGVVVVPPSLQNEVIELAESCKKSNRLRPLSGDIEKRVPAKEPYWKTSGALEILEARNDLDWQ